MRHVEINGGLVEKTAVWRLTLPVVVAGYANAQIDDYEQKRRSQYPWLPNTRLRLRACFSHDASQLCGTAGFGFWNAPFGDPTVPWPTLPQAVWFFFGSPPNDLPLASTGAGRGWFAATLDATTPRAWSMAPLSPFVVLLNRWPRFRQRIWPRVQQRLGISYAQLATPMNEWHDYELVWRKEGCHFLIDDKTVLQTPRSPRGPLGFVCWIDNQFMAVTPNGRFRYGTLPIAIPQTLEIENLSIQTIA